MDANLSPNVDNLESLRNMVDFFREADERNTEQAVELSNHSLTGNWVIHSDG